MTAASLLDRYSLPHLLRQASRSELVEIADAVRQELISVVANTGGHLGASLGVVELTIALHYVFDTPHDRILYDVGHQAYVHKMLTGRRDQLASIRQQGGISGFTRRSESVYDPFGAAHSSTSISAGLGFAEACKHRNDLNHRVIAVIGDGALSAGLAYEGMNNLGFLKTPMLVILNDNGMSIAPAVGAMSNYLKQLPHGQFGRGMHEIARKVAKRVVNNFPKPVREFADVADSVAYANIHPRSLFDDLGLNYQGPIDGHDIIKLVDHLERCKGLLEDGPVFLHCLTEKGHGYPPAENAEEKYHGVSRFDIATGKATSAGSNTVSYTSTFAKQLVAHAKRDPAIVAITAAMPSGTGLNHVAKALPDRVYDVGIAEQHAVTFAAGFAAEGLKPFVAIYATFLQRAYDQIVHDVALQHLPVRFIVDRAGFVGADGASHAGSFDLMMLTCLPEMVVMAPSSAQELAHMLATQRVINDQPSVLRFPRGNVHGNPLADPDNILPPIPIGKARSVRDGKHAVILSLGSPLHDAILAADTLAAKGIDIAVVDARFAKPIDAKMVVDLAENFPLLITIEEAALGGFSTQVLDVLICQKLNQTCDIMTLAMPDRFIDHATPDQQRVNAGLDAASIATRIIQRLDHPQTIARKITNI